MAYSTPALTRALESEPVHRGRSKTVYDLGDGYCLVRLVPSLHSFTYRREALVPGTDRLRLAFFAKAAARLKEAGVPCAFVETVDDTSYISRYCPTPPFEVIVKNVANGSTVRKYPGLFPPGHVFGGPVVKFDYRVDPEDQPIAEDYLREYGLDPVPMRQIALRTNEVLRDWLAPRTLWDFCIILGEDGDGGYTIASEVSPDGMRLKDVDGSALDKDLFRTGREPAEILAVWTRLVDSLD